MPAALTVTALKPDITVMDVEKNVFEILELSVPFEDCITSRHKHKADKYAHFCTDITTHKTTVTAFEVGVRGFLTSDNLKRLKYIYTFTTKNMSQKKFIENCSALAIMGSFYLFTARKEPTWSNPGYLTPPPIVQSSHQVYSNVECWRECLNIRVYLAPLLLSSTFINRPGVAGAVL